MAKKGDGSPHGVPASASAGGEQRATSTLTTLPQTVASAIEAFVAAVRDTLGADLQSIVLFGSAATGQLRATSDVNVLVLLRRFEAAVVEKLRPAAEAARLQINLRPMWILA